MLRLFLFCFSFLVLSHFKFDYQVLIIPIFIVLLIVNGILFLLSLNFFKDQDGFVKDTSFQIVFMVAESGFSCYDYLDRQGGKEHKGNND